MRLRLTVTTTATTIPWPAVLAPGRGVAYTLLHRVAPQLGARLRAQGWGPHRMVPFGYSAADFPAARRVPGAYAAGGTGHVELGSPLDEIVDAWDRALERDEAIDWGGITFKLVDVELLDPPKCDSGSVRWRTTTPVILKTADDDHDSRGGWILPREPGWAERLIDNLRRKAETLGLTADIGLRRVVWVGAQRSYAVGSGRGAKPGAPAEVELIGDPATLRAVWSWGLGQNNSAGFGWIRGRVGPDRTDTA